MKFPFQRNIFQMRNKKNQHGKKPRIWLVNTVFFNNFFLCIYIINSEFANYSDLKYDLEPLVWNCADAMRKTKYRFCIIVKIIIVAISRYELF